MGTRPEWQTEPQWKTVTQVICTQSPKGLVAGSLDSEYLASRASSDSKLKGWSWGREVEIIMEMSLIDT